MRLAFISMGNPRDPRNWSGTPYYALAEISGRVDDICIIETPRLDRLLAKINGGVRRFGFDLTRNPIVLALYAKSVRRQLDAFSPDAILAIDGFYKIASCETRYPIVYVTDALYCTIINYYTKFKRLRPGVRRRGLALERAFVQPENRRFALMSQWAIDSAMAGHDLPPSRTSVVPIGANVVDDPGRVVLDRPKDDLTLLWVGLDWTRKGGDLLLQAFKIVQRSQPDAQLHIVGVEAESAQGRLGVTVHGYLRKSDPEQRRKLFGLFNEVSLYVMMSAEEAYGLVYCEAAAYGIPSIGYRTGGVTTIVEDGHTGVLLSLNASPDDVAAAIVDLWSNQPRYEAMRQAARERYESMLNWPSWGEAIMRELTIAVEGNRVVAQATTVVV